MCSESHYCTLAEYIICHAAFTGCHLAERLQSSWKPLSASNDIIKIGALVAWWGPRIHLLCHRSLCPESPWEQRDRAVAAQILLWSTSPVGDVLRGAEAAGTPAWPGEPL